MPQEADLGYIGLGKMGYNMVTRLTEHGVSVVGWDVDPNATQKIAEVGGIPAKDIGDLVHSVKIPRTIWVMVPSDQPGPVEDVLDQLQPKLVENDLVIDGGNSKYKFAEGRAAYLARRGIHFMDWGVSGGPEGARNGAAVMIGGSVEDYERTKWLAEIIALPDAYTHVGPVGAGHYVKMVHNGIEYGMMQAIAEGFGVLKGGPYDLDPRQVARAYKTGTVIASRLVDWVNKGLEANPNLEGVSSIIGHSGEGEWTLEEAERIGIDVPAIRDAFFRRVDSYQVDEDSLDGVINKMVNMQRGQFGGHDVSVK